MSSVFKYFFLFLLIANSSFAQSVKEILLNANWQFRQAGDKEWMPATVPGTVHTDLLANKKISDPFWGTNEKDLQWIEDIEWEYQVVFPVGENILNQSNIELEFEGLDTYAKVFLNDSLILSADNMFRRWIVDIKGHLKKKDNHLLIHFSSASRKGKELERRLPHTLPGDEKVFTRKAQYQYGWDWGPRFVTCGIWRFVKITAWNKVKIISAFIRQRKFTDSLAIMDCVAEVHSDDDLKLFFFVTDVAQIRYHTIVSIGTDVQINKGVHNISFSFPIRNPKRWWSNGLGAQYLYSYAIQIQERKKLLDSITVNFGLRTIELIQEKDSIGKSFYFKLNGVPVFMKGANWIPADNFLPRMTRDKYRQLLVKAKEANINMLRVWGGGIYEDDYFYSLCDSLGILVWQDFMFACAMYPGDSVFVSNVREEVRDNVKRLRNHPCIALWCGNNEIDEGWKNWGWQKQYKYSANDSARIYSDYKNLFGKIIPDVLAAEDGTRAYWESSPSIGWGHKESLEQGDSHYWGVWWGMEPFETYQKKVGRFMSEYGFQGMPSLSTFKKFCDEKYLSLTSDEVKNHQKHPTGYETIQKYLERDYKHPKDFESYIYVSQLLQAEGMKTAIEAHRITKPRCMGTLYWQFNDCWPVTSWSSIDYYGKPKAFYYTSKKAYEKYFIGAVVKDSILTVTVVSDDTAEVQASFRVRIMDFTGNVLWKDSGSVNLYKEISSGFYPFVLEDMLRGISEFRTFFRMELFLNGKAVSENVFYFVKPMKMILDKAEIKFHIQAVTDYSYTISLSSKSLAKNVLVDFGDLEVSSSDNFFDLLPGEEKIITVTGTVTSELLKEKIKIKSLVDSY